MQQVKRFSFFFLLITLVTASTILPAFTEEEFIATINGEKILLSDFNRLVISKKKKLIKELNFDVYSPPNEAVNLKRKGILVKARTQGIQANPLEINESWQELVNTHSSFEDLQKKAMEKALSISDLRKKTEENILIEKYLETEIKEDLIEQIVNEHLTLEEASQRNIEINNEEINQKLNTLIAKLGGEEAFTNFLSDNNASLEDARNEIKKQFLYKALKQQIGNEENFKALISERRKKSNIIVYTDKIFNADISEDTNNLATLRKNPYENEINIASEETNNLLEEVINNDLFEDSANDEINITDLREPIIVKPIIQDNSQKEQNRLTDFTEIPIIEIKETTASNNSQPQNNNEKEFNDNLNSGFENRQKALKELKRRIEQKKVTFQE